MSKPVQPITEGKMSKGGQNVLGPIGERPPAPGSRGDYAVGESLEPIGNTVHCYVLAIVHGGMQNIDEMD